MATFNVKSGLHMKTLPRQHMCSKFTCGFSHVKTFALKISRLSFFLLTLVNLFRYPFELKCCTPCQLVVKPPYYHNNEKLKVLSCLLLPKYGLTTMDQSLCTDLRVPFTYDQSQPRIQIPSRKSSMCMYEGLYMLASVRAVSRVGRLCRQKVHLVL